MECFLRCYFEYFNSLPRNTLHDRRKRKHMVDYVSTLIEGCSKGSIIDSYFHCSRFRNISEWVLYRLQSKLGI